MLCSKMFHTKMTKLTFIKKKLSSKFEVQIPWFFDILFGFQMEGMAKVSFDKSDSSKDREIRSDNDWGSSTNFDLYLEIFPPKLEWFKMV